MIPHDILSPKSNVISPKSNVILGETKKEEEPKKQTISRNNGSSEISETERLRPCKAGAFLCQK